MDSRRREKVRELKLEMNCSFDEDPLVMRCFHRMKSKPMVLEARCIQSELQRLELERMV